MELENDVKTVIAEMAGKLNKNYSEQKLFDLSLGRVSSTEKRNY